MTFLGVVLVSDDELELSIQPMPLGLQARGRQLWIDVTGEHVLSVDQLQILTEACRTADRLDELDNVIQGKGVLELLRFRTLDRSGLGDRDDPIYIEVTFDKPLAEARQQQNIFKQLLVSLRLPDAEGVRPQKRGSRGAYSKSATPPSTPQTPPRKVMESALEKAKRAAG